MGGFQRANLYDKKVKHDEKTRKEFRERLHVHIKAIALSQYSKEVNPIKHIDNIKNISEFTAASTFSFILNNGHLNFGVSQKLLNLYLKYLWCMDIVVIPPHFPVDRIIQIKLNEKAKEMNIPTRQIISWTQMTSPKEYLEIISHAKQVLTKSKFENLAELELDIFERN